MTPPYITTTVYKYNRYAPWILGVYCILLVSLFIFSAYLPPVLVGICAAVLLLLPVYSVIKRKSIFSIRSVDERLLSIEANNVYWDGATIPLNDVTKLSIYLYAFENFRHAESGLMSPSSRTTEYGDQNKLSFDYQDKEYDFTFYLSNYLQYQTALQIIKAWQSAGYEVKARTAFADAYIQQEVARYGV